MNYYQALNLENNLEELLLNYFVFCIVYFLVFFLISVLRDDYSSVDSGWSIGIVLSTLLTYYFKTEAQTFYSKIIIFLVFIWGARLSLHRLVRNIRDGEDFRYQNLRIKWPKFFKTQIFFKVFLVQAILQFVVILPLIVGLNSPLPKIKFRFSLGIIVFIIGFAIESISDFQLFSFKSLKKNHKKVLSSGMWKWCRHPNYLGEITLWWGIFLCCYTKNYKWIYTGPMMLTLFIAKISGVPLIERRFSHNKDYQLYKDRTGSIFPISKKPHSD
ncbi:MAG: DUF1295 domain-containing protein [Bacteriovoracaceae bacterium]|jgi:steroid 5-alpha reductase family enzyme|nr:DUF1295 domain-containing protein [Bacteriovoracaceae bacterium]